MGIYSYVFDSGPGFAAVSVARHFYAFFIPPQDFQSCFYTAKPKLSVSFRWRSFMAMDLVFVAGAVALWGVSVLMVWGFRKLEKTEGGRA